MVILPSNMSLLVVCLFLFIDIILGIIIPTDYKLKPWLPSGKRVHSYGKIHHFSWVNQLFIWAIFNSYVCLPGGIWQGGAPRVISWFINHSNYVYIYTINPSNGVINQLSELWGTTLYHQIWGFLRFPPWNMVSHDGFPEQIAHPILGIYDVINYSEIINGSTDLVV